MGCYLLGLVLPESVEPRGRHRGVARRVLQVAMSEIGGDRPSVDAIIHELVPAGVPQDMRMDALKADCLGGTPQHLEEAARAHRRFALGHEDERSWLVLAHAAQRSDFDAGERMRAALTAFEAMDVDASDLQVDLIPAQRHELADAQAVPIGQEDHGRVPVPVAPASLMEGVSSPLWPDRRMANHHSCRTRFATRSGCGAR